MKASPIQNSFNAGELSPQLRGRADLEKYKNGCETLENFIPQIFGPARKRPGTRFVAETKDSTKSSRLIPFEFSTTQAFALEFGDEVIRFFADGGIIETSPGVPYEIVSPYDHTDLAQLNYAQSADVIYLAHPDYPVYKLARLGATNWTITAVTFARPPFNDVNVTATTITASAVSGAITLTASAALFVAADVGSYFSLSVIPAAQHDQWTTGVVHVFNDIVQYQGRVYEAQNGATAGSRPPLHTEGVVSDGAVDWLYLHDGTGYALVTGYTSSTVVNATVITRLPTTVTKKWAEGSWSPRRGYPRAVTFYEDRLWFGGSNFLPQTLWASVTSDYENFTLGTDDDSGLSYTINTQDLNTIAWLSPGKVLAAGTANGEFTLSGNQVSDAITPTSIRITPQTTYGCTDTVRPIRVAASTLFVQRSARKIREYTYNFETDAYVAPNLTLLAEHITQAGIVDMAYQQEPYQVVWTPDADGALLGLTYERAEDVVGWHRHTIGGRVESVITLPHWDGETDVLWMIVKRTIDGNVVRYVEYMEQYRSNDYAFYVDCGLTYDGAPTTTISGLAHLEGEELDILADGAVHPRRTVSGGQITLQASASVVNVGLPYTATLVTMPLEAGARDGVAQGKTQRINNIVLRLFETGPGLWYGSSLTMLDELHLRGPGDPMDNPVPLYTGDTEALPWPGEYEQGAQMVVRHQLPTPCTLVALMPQVTTNDR